jgi:hypothetical protein
VISSTASNTSYAPTLYFGPAGSGRSHNLMMWASVSALFERRGILLRYLGERQASAVNAGVASLAANQGAFIVGSLSLATVTDGSPACTATHQTLCVPLATPEWSNSDIASKFRLSQQIHRLLEPIAAARAIAKGALNSALLVLAYLFKQFSRSSRTRCLIVIQRPWFLHHGFHPPHDEFAPGSVLCRGVSPRFS